MHFTFSTVEYSFFLTINFSYCSDIPVVYFLLGYIFFKEWSSPSVRSIYPQVQQTPHSSSPSSPCDLRFHVVSSSPRSLRDSQRRGRIIKPQRVL